MKNKVPFPPSPQYNLMGNLEFLDVKLPVRKAKIFASYEFFLWDENYFDVDVERMNQAI